MDKHGLIYFTNGESIYRIYKTEGNMYLDNYEDIFTPSSDTSHITSLWRPPSPLGPGRNTPCPTGPGRNTPSPTRPDRDTPSPTGPIRNTPQPTRQIRTTPNPTLPVPPIPFPTVSPTFETCGSEDALNIGFLLDESGSINITEWEILIQFVNRIITYDIARTSYVSLFEFASLTAWTQFLDWTHVRNNKQIFTDSLNNNPYNPVGLTYTWDAVSRVLDEYWHYKYTCTDGCQFRSDLLFILTDGVPSDTVCPDIQHRVNITDIDIVLIIISHHAQAENITNAISCLDIRDNGKDIYTIPKFGSTEFHAIEDRIREKTCSGRNTGM